MDDVELNGNTVSFSIGRITAPGPACPIALALNRNVCIRITEPQRPISPIQGKIRALLERHRYLPKSALIQELRDEHVPDDAAYQEIAAMKEEGSLRLQDGFLYLADGKEFV